jgi:hypothetical protein
MRQHPTPLQEHLSQISQAQFIAQPPEHDEEHDIGGIFKKVEGSATPFIENALTGRTAERSIAKRGLLRLLFRSR